MYGNGIVIRSLFLSILMQECGGGLVVAFTAVHASIVLGSYRFNLMAKIKNIRFKAAKIILQLLKGH